MIPLYEDIKEQFIEIIRAARGIDEPQVDELFETWQKNKKKFIDRFGGLIYEWPIPITFNVDPQSKRVKATIFAAKVENDDLSLFLLDNVGSFYDNVVSDNRRDCHIPKGMKLIKAFKYFEKDPKQLRKYQDQASAIIQEDKICGTLCFSVHPLDFLSASENTYNWTSCHNMVGDYSAGNLSYMADEVTFMVYLKGEEHALLPHFGDVEWNSKRWRMFLYTTTNDSFMMAGRQYPFASKDGIDNVLRIYNNILSKEPVEDSYGFITKKYLPWQQDYITSYRDKELNSRYLVINQYLKDINTVVQDDPYMMGYNDLLYSSDYEEPYFTTLDSRLYEHNMRFPMVVGGRAPCMCCGMSPITSSSFMRCDYCEFEYGDGENENISHCDECGARVWVSEGYYTDDLDLICRDCFYENYFECKRCGKVFSNEVKFYLHDSSIGLDEDVCPECYLGYKDWKEQEREEKSIG